MKKENTASKNSADSLIVGEKSPSIRDRLKSKIKEMIRKQMREMTGSGAVGGGAGSAGPVKTPNAFGKVKDPTTGLDGYKKIGSSELDEKKVEDSGNKKPEDKPTAKPAAKPEYKPIVAQDDELSVARKALKLAANRLDVYSKKSTDAAAKPAADKEEKK
jgi:hypothetical protein